jgi:hypothetical protein
LEWNTNAIRGEVQLERAERDAMTGERRRLPVSVTSFKLWLLLVLAVLFQNGFPLIIDESRSKEYSLLSGWGFQWRS